MTTGKRSSSSALISTSLLAALVLAVVWSMWGTRNWPLVGDVSLMRYAVFLQDHGMAPYRDVVDINLPGTYLVERMAMQVFGASSFGLRLYDWSLLACIAAACIWTAGKKHWFAGLFAGSLFALVHLQDGVAQQGQRDLILAILALIALGALRRCLSGEGTQGSALLFGLSLGFSFTVKPVLLPLAALCVLVCLILRMPLRLVGYLASALAGVVLPPVVVLLWLEQKGAGGAFLNVVQSLLPLHASLGRRSLGFLVGHSVSPIGLLLVLALIVVLFHPVRSISRERWLLVVGLVGTLAAYITQGKGFPYQRYPFLVLLLLAVGLVAERGLEYSGRTYVVTVVLLLCAVGMGGMFARRSTTYESRAPFLSALSAQLGKGSSDRLQGNVQCLDTFGGCINTLYSLRIRQSTGILYDCYLFTPPSAAREAYRDRFWVAFTQTRPRFVVVSSQNCFAASTDGYDRLRTWPKLDEILKAQYRQVSEWTPTQPVLWFSRRQMPYGFRLLERVSD